MDIAELRKRISDLAVWKQGDQRALHKPLLILYALGKLQTDERILPYQTVRERLRDLLMEFGQVRQSYHPEEPFVRLKNDGIWELDTNVDYRYPSNKKLLDQNVSGGFTTEVNNLLMSNPHLIQEIAQLILEEHFPDTLHGDILESVGLDFTYYKRKKRDPQFRDKVLRAYGYSCAICGFNVRLGHTLVGVEAAHIKWHQAGGPDKEENGLALCSLHHKLFDKGVFTISNNRKMIVSQYAHGTHGFREMLLKYHEREIKKPMKTLYNPNGSFLNWHAHEVFKETGTY